MSAPACVDDVKLVGQVAPRPIPSETSLSPVPDAANADFAAKIWFPSTIDFHILPDMSRING